MMEDAEDEERVMSVQSIIQEALGMYPGGDDSQEVPIIQPGDDVIQEISQKEDMKNKELVEWDTIENMVRQEEGLQQRRYDMCPESFLIRLDQMSSEMFLESLEKIKVPK